MLGLWDDLRFEAAADFELEVGAWADSRAGDDWLATSVVFRSGRPVDTDGVFSKGAFCTGTDWLFAELLLSLLLLKSVDIDMSFSMLPSPSADTS